MVVNDAGGVKLQ